MMERLWNCKTAVPPPACTLQYKETLAFDLKGIRKLLEQINASLQDQTSLETELYLLKKVLYKGNNQFRYDKFFQSLKKMERCLKLWMEGHLLKTFRELGDTIPIHIPVDEPLYLPCQQLGHHALVRVMGLAAVLTKAVIYSMEAYGHMAGQVHLGFFVPGMLFNSALVSRIWVLCKARLLELCQWYQRLKAIVDTLPSSKVQWLPVDEGLPVDLETWLAQFTDPHGRVDKKEGGALSTVGLAGDKSTLERSHLMPLSNTINEEMVESENSVDDIGVAISREAVVSDNVKAFKELKSFKGVESVTSAKNTEITKLKTDLTLFDDKATKVMDKAHNFLAKEIGQPYSTKPRVKNSPKWKNEDSEKGNINLRKWSSRIQSCKSFAMIFHVMGELQISVRPKFMIRGYLKMLNEIKSIRRESFSKDVQGGKKVALDMIKVIKRDGFKERKPQNYKQEQVNCSQTDEEETSRASHENKPKSEAILKNNQGEATEKVTATRSRKSKGKSKDNDSPKSDRDLKTSEVVTCNEISHRGMPVSTNSTITSSCPPTQPESSRDSEGEKLTKSSRKDKAKRKHLQTSEKGMVGRKLKKDEALGLRSCAKLSDCEGFDTSCKIPGLVIPADKSLAKFFYRYIKQTGPSTAFKALRASNLQIKYGNETLQLPVHSATEVKKLCKTLQKKCSKVKKTNRENHNMYLKKAASQLAKTFKPILTHKIHDST